MQVNRNFTDIYIHGPTKRGFYHMLILVYSTLIYTCKYKQLNHKKCISNNGTAVHVLGHKHKSVVFPEKGKIMLKKDKNS